MEYESAINDLKVAFDYNSQSISVLNNLAIAYIEIGRTKEAIQFLERAATLQPNYTGSYVNLARLYTKTDQYDEALFYYEKAITLSPNEPLVYSNRGELHYRMKQYSKAITDINKSIDMYPSNSYAYRNRALAYLALGKREESCRDLAAAEYYGFATNYGEEVQQLIQENCQGPSNLSEK